MTVRYKTQLSVCFFAQLHSNITLNNFYIYYMVKRVGTANQRQDLTLLLLLYHSSNGHNERLLYHYYHFYVQFQSMELHAKKIAFSILNIESHRLGKVV